MHISIEHKKKYLHRRVDEIKDLKHCLDNEDFDIAFNIGHRLKGNGETFGYPLISVLGITIEQAAIAKDKIKLANAIVELEDNVKENLLRVQ